MSTSVARTGDRVDRLRATLGAPVDGAGLAWFRIAFGAVMIWEMWRFLDPAHGWVADYYTGKEFYFKYWPFTFVEPLPEPWIYLVFWATMAAAGLVMVGLFYRFAAPAMFLGLAYTFLLEEARYLNHFYLIVLLAFLLMWLPANRTWSLDARRQPSLASDTVPAWTVYLLRFQIGVPYLFGGIAKLNVDWLRGEPLRAWLADRTDFPVIGTYFTDEPVVWAMTYGALLLDLSVAFLLLRRPTRAPAYGATVVFHLMNSRLFGIGVFPWLMIPATAVFFDPSWPRRVLADLRTRGEAAEPRRRGLLIGAAIGFLFGGYLPNSFSLWRAGIGATGVAILAYHLVELRGEPTRVPDEVTGVTARTTSTYRLASSTLALLALWAGIQVTVPLRHLAIPGDVHWTEEGHTYAWHMKLRDKDADADFTVVADGQSFEIDLDDILTNRQESKMEARPEMMVQFAKYLEEEFTADGYTNVEVYVEAFASLNGREDQRFIDPTFDLTTQSFPWFGPREWILPLETPLRRGGDVTSADEE